ncbi:hypothetical protein ABK040_010305 [Willaertia magna]
MISHCIKSFSFGFKTTKPLFMFQVTPFQRSVTSKIKNIEKGKVRKETSKEVDTHFLRLTAEEEETMKKMNKDVVYNAYITELERYEDDIWLNAKRKGKLLSIDEIQYIKNKIKEKRIELFKKYQQMDKVYNKEKSSKPTATERRKEKEVFEELSKVFKENAHFLDLPEFKAIKEEFQKKTGFSIPEGLQDQYTPEQIEEFMKMLDGEPGKELEEYMNTVLSDEVFAKFGVNAQDYNPFRYPEEPSKGPKKITPEEFDTLKHAMMADLKKNSFQGMEHLMTEQTGKSVDALMDIFYREIKDVDAREYRDFLDEAKERNAKYDKMKKEENEKKNK